MTKTPSIVLLVAAVLWCFADSLPSFGDDWPQFLGPNRDGQTASQGFATSWPKDGPKEIWRAPGGVGMSGIAVQGDRLVTMWNSTRGQVVAALRTSDGKQLWATSVAANYKNGQGDGPRATPTIVGDRVFSYSGQGVLSCLTLDDGDIVWSSDLADQFSIKPAEYGLSSSPLAVGDVVIVTLGGNLTIVALNQKTGDVQWTSGSGAPGYSSPALLQVASQQQVVAFTASGVTALDPKSGDKLWSYPFKTPYDCNTASAISIDGSVFVSAGENHGCVLLGVQRQGGSFQVKPVWESVNVKSVMRNEWQTSVLIDGYLYGFDNVGSAGPTTHLTCIEASTGDVQWRETRYGKGNLVAANGCLWITMMSGELIQVRANPEEYQELGRKKLFGKTRQCLALSDGRGYIRDNKEIISIDLSK